MILNVANRISFQLPICKSNAKFGVLLKLQVKNRFFVSYRIVFTDTFSGTKKIEKTIYLDNEG